MGLAQAGTILLETKKMKRELKKFGLWAGSVVAVLTATTPVEAQTDRAIERRVDRNERQLQRQVNRADYYSNSAWQQLDPWIKQSGVVPIPGAAVAENTVNAAANATGKAAKAVGKAVRQTADAATRVGDGLFGFRDKSPQAAWFYDYYTVPPTYYVPQGDDRYSSAIRYFDHDNDGVFESQSSYRDSDNDGRYDEYDQLDFYASAGPQNNSATAKNRTQAHHESGMSGPEDSRRHRMSGEIGMTKVAQVNGNEHLVVALKMSDQQESEQQDFAIDLGPSDRLRDKQIEVGTQIVAFGALEQVGEKKLLVADSFQVGDGEPIQVSRGYGQTFTGEIIDIKTVPMDNAENYLAVVNINGERQLVDLGPTTTYKVALEPSTKITIQGVPVHSSNHRVILAEQIDMGNKEVIRIERARRF
jgi:hypothetical protein